MIEATVKEVAAYVSLTSVTLVVAYVWAKISLAEQKMIEIPYPILIVLLLGWGLKVPPEIVNTITGVL